MYGLAFGLQEADHTQAQPEDVLILCSNATAVTSDQVLKSHGINTGNCAKLATHARAEFMLIRGGSRLQKHKEHCQSQTCKALSLFICVLSTSLLKDQAPNHPGQDFTEEAGAQPHLRSIKLAL